ncbi:LysR family transcriptional regulator [Idiomarina xiamenensis]|uniref:LysR family transcriptional regulator n=1 Tax=Idiomarina xiamenensis 10-D-4 TaxID=740709 RepID=K2K287_9GAMM|nr:LysR family transcriptional regulator [Idiomarina xiamenensis]EKE80797.1 LysR family transcriptional regulator [Idiomarina xiamenensis 10-D-4]
MSNYRPKTTVEQWRILQAVVDHGGYAHAAEFLNKSQSSLNHAVAKLQQVLGIQLLEVRGRKAELTQAGQVMLRRSRQLTQTITDLEQLADNLTEGWEPEVRLAIEMVFDRTPLVPVLQEFEHASRGTRLTIEDTVLTGTLEHISEKTADVVITYHLPKGAIGEPLADFKLELVCHPNHPLAQHDEAFAQSELSQHLQIVIRDTALSPREEEGWLKAEQRWTVSHFDEALRLVKSGLGFCWLPPYITEQAIRDGQLKRLQLAGSSHRRGQLYLILPKGDNAGPCARRLAELILAHCKGDPMQEAAE